MIIGEGFGMHHQLGGSTEDDMNKMSVIGHISLYINKMGTNGGGGWVDGRARRLQAQILVPG